MKTICLLFAGVFSIAPSGAHAALSGHDLMAKNEEARKFTDLVSDASIATSDNHGSPKVKTFTWKRKLLSDGVRYNTLTRFHSPVEVRDEAILFIEHANDQNEVLIYLPNFKKTRRVEVQLQSESFMGSAFSYADISTPHTDDYKSKFLREEKCPNAPVSCYVVEATPATDSVRDRTGYSRSIMWFRKDNMMTAQGDNYGTDGTLFKRIQGLQFEEIDKAKHRWIATQVKIENMKSNKQTELDFKNIRANRGIPDSNFNPNNLAVSQ